MSLPTNFHFKVKLLRSKLFWFRTMGAEVIVLANISIDTYKFRKGLTNSAMEGTRIGRNMNYT